MTDQLKRTTLHQWHVDHGARMIPFAGWEMPVQYATKPIEEHHITRRSAGLFDIDHMGQVAVSGADAEAYLNRLVSWDVSQMAENEAHYALVCYENGGIIDDVFIYRLLDHWLVVINASNREKDLTWMEQQATDFNVSIQDISDETYMMALQGPSAIPLLQHLTNYQLDNLERFTAVEISVTNVPMLVGRTGYTGEDGVELFLPDNQALHVWTEILNAGPQHGIEVAPIGLAARDSLRFEPGFALYGHEIDETITPIEARLSWACSFDKPFIGRDALLAQKEAGVQKRLITFELLDRGVPREGYAITDDAGSEIGQVVAGLYAPSVDKYCGNAFVPPSHAKTGTEINIQIRNQPKRAVVVKRPLYRPSYRGN